MPRADKGVRDTPTPSLGSPTKRQALNLLWLRPQTENLSPFASLIVAVMCVTIGSSCLAFWAMIQWYP